MTTLTVSTTTDFSAALLTDIDLLDFTNTGSATATFAALQFDNLAILDALMVEGNIFGNHILVSGGTVDASQWSFLDWAAADTITLLGGSAADIITGSTEADTIQGAGSGDTLNGGAGGDEIRGGSGRDIIIGGSGADSLYGGNQNDQFVIDAPGSTGPGEVIDGGGGSGDKIVVAGSFGTANFIFTAISGVEILEYRAGGPGGFQ